MAGFVLPRHSLAGVLHSCGLGFSASSVWGSAMYALCQLGCQRKQTGSEHLVPQMRLKSTLDPCASGHSPPRSSADSCKLK